MGARQTNGIGTEFGAEPPAITVDIDRQRAQCGPEDIIGQPDLIQRPAPSLAHIDADPRKLPMPAVKLDRPSANAIAVALRCRHRPSGAARLRLDGDELTMRKTAARN